MIDFLTGVKVSHFCLHRNRGREKPGPWRRKES